MPNMQESKILNLTCHLMTNVFPASQNKHFFFRSLLFWPKASLMTNNAVNPIVYVYSNVNIQRFLILKCAPKFIAEKTETFQEFKKSQQNKMFSSAAVFKSNFDPANKSKFTGKTAASRNTGTFISTTACSGTEQHFGNRTNVKTSHEIAEQTNSVETVQTPHSQVTSVEDRAAQDDLGNRISVQNRTSSLINFARRISRHNYSLKRTQTLEPTLSFAMRYNEFMECQLEWAENLQEVDEEEREKEVKEGAGGWRGGGGEKCA